MERVWQQLVELEGGWVVAIAFLLPLLESSTLLGLVVPGEVVLLLAGALASSGRAPLGAVCLASCLGAIAGDSLGYWAGRRWGEKLLGGPLARLLGSARLSRARRHLQRRGFLAVVFGRFPPYVRTLAPALAGMSRMPYPRFVGASVVGGTCWGVTSVAAGYLAGEAWTTLERAHRTAGWVVLGLVAAAVACALARRAARRSRAAG
jgi:membrane-associated protein